MFDRKLIKIMGLLFLIVILLCLLAFYFLLPKLSVEQNEKSFDVFDNYESVRYKASFLNNDLSNNVFQEGIVDTSKVGNYEVTYHLKFGLLDIKKIVRYRVIDSIPPEISLIDGNEYRVCSLNSYIEPGYSANDNYDGDITENVKTSIDNDDVIYDISDSSGNIAHETRKLIVSDIEKPTIKLNGESIIYVPINGYYNELGATSNDNCSGNLNNRIQLSGKVDTSKLASYKLTYSVTDDFNNSSEITRKVVIFNPDSSNNVGGVIYLTFDDGPGTYTNQILDILDKYNIKATFFVTNAGSDAIILREFQSGHTIGLHTATHQWSIYSSVDNYFNDLNIISNRVKNITGYDSKFIRFPGGSSNTVSKHYQTGIMTTLTQEVENRGYEYFDWNVCVEDAGICAKKGVKNRESCVINYFEKGLVAFKNNYVLLHDIKSYTANSLETMIQYALSQGYTFKNIDFSTPTYHQRVNN